MTKEWNERGKKERKKYVDAMGKLYGDKVADVEVFAPVVKKKAKAKRKDCPLEKDEQIRLAVKLDKLGILWTSTANGGSRHKVEAVSIRRQGLKKGVQDILIFEPRGKYHGALIELKRVSGGTLSMEQQYWRDEAAQRGYFTAVCKGCDNAYEVITKYLGQ